MKTKVFILFLLTGLTLAGCQVNVSKKEALSTKNLTASPTEKVTENQASNSNDKARDTSQYATEEDVIKKEETRIEQKDYILYTFKGHKSVALPKNVSLEEAQIDLSTLPKVGTSKEEVEK
ncbi:MULTISPECIES: hypothetical protein [unclassified Enterococcus]|uniref:hypothetical protein n=1 Tax=unclassified Enterococcus TaxID=2608891 RepID=UPI001554AED7|nr:MULTISPECIES: hypothetical protein [unclassified Enterococcus]MBS7577585.1 hypothetical protein [Enterococcus sp. MMGLQ5-2]MBS7584916.1 hypothetical protein [Enterococcus sp. MMGLQ5-1]NPD12771.1 hypothetical protein [Enterococcus sp. MMGLQ5-1]NPD37418.1 hypothetical protein [Enterococcus sp. MMGLQ5-2]